MPSVFLSHSSKDKVFARKLANQLKNDNIEVWFDEAELKIGDSLLNKIGDAIDLTDFLIVVLSSNSINSTWVQNELKVALTREFDEKRVIVLPVVIEPIKIPVFLRDKLYANFIEQSDFKVSYERLYLTIFNSNKLPLHIKDKDDMIIHIKYLLSKLPKTIIKNLTLQEIYEHSLYDYYIETTYEGVEKFIFPNGSKYSGNDIYIQFIAQDYDKLQYTLQVLCDKYNINIDDLE